MPTGRIGTAARSDNPWSYERQYSSRGLMDAFRSGQGGDWLDAIMMPRTTHPELEGIGVAQVQGERAGLARVAEGERITRETEARREQTLGHLQGEQERASQETLSQETIDKMFGAAADDATRDTEALMRSLRSHLGQSGVRGGAAAGMAAGIELSRLGQLTDARRDLTVVKAQADAQDRLNRWQRAFQIGEVMNQEPSAFLADVLGDVQDAALFREALFRQEFAADRLAQAQERAGDKAFEGQLIGSGIGLAGLAFG